MTHKIAKIWNRVSYETMIFIAFLIRFLSTRALDLDTWSSAWDAMDYSMGNGSRLLIGSIYKLFYGDYLDVTVAYKYVGIGICGYSSNHSLICKNNRLPPVRTDDCKVHGIL